MKRLVTAAALATIAAALCAAGTHVAPPHHRLATHAARTTRPERRPQRQVPVWYQRRRIALVQHLP